MPTGIYKRIIGINCGKGVSNGSKGKHWNLSKKIKKKLSINNPKFWLGKKFSEKHKKKIKEAHKGKKKPWVKNLPQIFKKGYIPWIKGKKSPWTSERLRKLKGEKNPSWKGGKSFEPYTTDWTETLRRSIRERDNYICQLCSQYGNTVHHIFYDKKNCNPKCLITLCKKCNSKVNFNREYWIRYFKERMSIDREDN